MMDESRISGERRCAHGISILFVMLELKGLKMDCNQGLQNLTFKRKLIEMRLPEINDGRAECSSRRPIKG